MREKRCETCEWWESAEDVAKRWKAQYGGNPEGRFFISRCHTCIGGTEVVSDDWCSKWQKKEEA